MANEPPIKKRREMIWSHHGAAGDAELKPVRDLTAADIGVAFQPIVSLADGSPAAWEALVRCNVPGLESPPALFESALLERATGRLGRLIREVAFQRGAGRALFVNVHPAELSSRWLVQPDDPLNFHDAEVFIEITEAATFEHFDLCLNVLREIRQRSAVRFVVDDLGAGHSNLKRVLDLEPSVVKLDISLVKGIDKNPKQFVLVESLTRLFERLGAKVVAEGIETVPELVCVRDAGVHFGQGYVLARPAFDFAPVHWPLR
ncbi:MAG: hypothetical protein JWM10_2993 [Myxococcaceae bacterium]|nr:hypothetical protein [Myxococcaceae bacterium]